ncbi:MAG: thiamine diphosphokinase [Clostridia bacterium]|nr:thiamine diphosphokinase [Clostridia bacterium]
MRAVIIAGGEFKNPDFYRNLINDSDNVICADGGYMSAQKMGIVPDVVIGDFDSYPQNMAQAKTEKIVLPTEKDKTDTHECVCYAIEHGFDEIMLFGATGTRLDHTIANIHLLKIALDNNVKMKIVDEHNEVYLTDNELSLKKGEGQHVSVLPIGRAEGISSTGLYYPMTDAVMEFGNPYGVSNEFNGDEATVSVKNGLLLVILSRD